MSNTKEPLPRVFVTCLPSAYDRLIGPGTNAVLESFARIERNTEERLLSDDELSQRLAEADGVIVGWPGQSNALSGPQIEAAKQLLIVGQLGQSIKQIDTAAVFARGITLVNSPSAFANAVAEFTLATMLCAKHRVVQHDRAMRSGTEAWGIRNAGTLGRELSRSTVGLIGYGGIGRRVAELLAPFDVELLVYDPFAGAAAGAFRVTFVPLDALLARSDVVSVHAALTAETGKMIGAGELERMKPDALLVNTARGGLVDEAALVAHLRRNPAFMAALDVFASEPLAADAPLRDMENVLLSSHRSGHTKEAYALMGVQVVEDFRRFFAGEQPLHSVTAA